MALLLYHRWLMKKDVVPTTDPAATNWMNRIKWNGTALYAEGADLKAPFMIEVEVVHVPTNLAWAEGEVTYSSLQGNLIYSSQTMLALWHTSASNE